MKAAQNFCRELQFFNSVLGWPTFDPLGSERDPLNLRFEAGRLSQISNSAILFSAPLHEVPFCPHPPQDFLCLAYDAVTSHRVRYNFRLLQIFMVKVFAKDYGLGARAKSALD